MIPVGPTLPVKKVPNQQQVLVLAHQLTARRLKELPGEDAKKIGYSALFHQVLTEQFKEVRKDVAESESGIIGMVYAVQRAMTTNPKEFAPAEKKFMAGIVSKMANLGPRGRYSMKQIEAILRLYYTTFASAK